MYKILPAIFYLIKDIIFSNISVNFALFMSLVYGIFHIQITVCLRRFIAIGKLKIRNSKTKKKKKKLKRIKKI